MKTGIPSLDEYEDNLRGKSFLELRNYSNEFLNKYLSLLSNYQDQWVRDPLHQWSRQWEYPFVYESLTDLIPSRPEVHILDAGSGATFFPYMLAGQETNVHVSCVDSDEGLKAVHEKLVASEGSHVGFSFQSIDYLNFSAESFDAVYCISVLEHTDNYENIIEEFFRILKPGGKLIITFDICLRAERDIPIHKAEQLLNCLCQQFSCEREQSISEILDMQSPFTTLDAGKFDDDILPWRFPGIIYRLHNLVKKGKWIQWPPKLTVYCDVFEKPE